MISDDFEDVFAGTKATKMRLGPAPWNVWGRLRQWWQWRGFKKGNWKVVYGGGTFFNSIDGWIEHYDKDHKTIAEHEWATWAIESCRHCDGLWESTEEVE